MTAIVGVGESYDNMTQQRNTHVAGLIAGEDLGALVPVYINSSGVIVESVGTVLATALCHGITAKAALSGEPVTLLHPGQVFTLDSAGGLTPGAPLFMGAAGVWEDAATSNDISGTAFAVSTTTACFAGFRLVGEGI